MTNQNTAYQLTLETGKKVVFREAKIKDETMATQLAVAKAEGSNALQLGPHLIIEMVKLLLVSIDGKNLTSKEKESLDDLFSHREWQQVKSFISDLIGGDTKAPKLEMISLAPASST